MHPDELANWTRIKEVFEENGTTDNYFYTRACAIVGGQPDPMSNLSHVTQNDGTEAEHCYTKSRGR